MALDPVPYFTGQAGVRHSAEVVRAALYASTNGAEGVSGVSDLKVQAQPVPNNTVQVIPGGALLLNRYAGGGGQSYTFRNASGTDVTITATGSSGGRTDLLVARVFDTQYEGTPPVDVDDFQYSRLSVIEGVPSNTKSARDLNLAYPAVALAKITIPANTATITNAMITDLRKVAQPNKRRDMTAIYPTANFTAPTTGYAYWPLQNVQRPRVDIPEWATKMILIAHIEGAKFTKGTGSADTVYGTKTSFAWGDSENGIIVLDSEDTNGRYNYTFIGTHHIAAQYRGGSQLMTLLATRSAGTGTLIVDYQSKISLDWEFSQEAD